MTALETIPGVEIFQVGTHRGEPWTVDDINAMARNYALLSDRLTPTAVVGHEATQSLMSDTPDNTGVPAVGAPKNLRVEYPLVKGVPTATLVADVADVPSWFADLVRARSYRTISAEIYGATPSGCEDARGPILRRIAFLGGEIPQVKTLKQLHELVKPTRFAECPATLKVTRAIRPDGATTPVLVFSEVTRMPTKAKKNKSRTAIITFTDPTPASPAVPPAIPAATTMTRPDVLSALQAAGFDTAQVNDQVPDGTLLEILRFYNTLAAQDAQEDAMDDGDDTTTMSGDDTTTMADSKTTNDSKGKTMSEKTLSPDQQAAVKTFVDKAVADATETIKAEAKRAADEVGVAMKKATDDAAASLKFAEEQRSVLKKQFVEATVAGLVKSGKVTPAEVDAGLVADLLTRDNQTAQKFGEKEVTPLAHAIGVLESRPAFAFGENRLKGNRAATNQDTEEAEVKKFAEDNAAVLKKSGRSAAFYAETFKKARERNPNLTAQEFLHGQTAA